MSQTTTYQPQLRDLLNLFKKEILMELNCHAIGIVESFDAADQTVTVKLAYSKTYFKNGVETQLPYPLLLDVPVVTLGGPNRNLTFPVMPGDECLVLFNDRDIDNWWQGATSGPPKSARLHSFSDGFALMSCFDVGSYDNTRIKLKNENTFIGLSASKVQFGNASTTLLLAVNSLITAIDTFTTATQTASVEPTLGPASAALKATLATVKTTFESLLE